VIARVLRHPRGRLEVFSERFNRLGDQPGVLWWPELEIGTVPSATLHCGLLDILFAMTQAFLKR